MKARANSGFTTLELLVALALTVILAAAISGGLGIGMHVWRVGRTADDQGNLEAAAQTLSNLLSKSSPVMAADLARKLRIIFIGRPDRIDFVYLSEGEAQWAGLIQAHMALGETGKLEFWSAVYRPETAWTMKAEQMTRADVVSHVRAFEIAYFGRLAPNQPAGWRTEWIGAEILPQLIKIRIVRTRHGLDQSVEFDVCLRQE